MPRSIVKRANVILKQLESDNAQVGTVGKPTTEIANSREGMQLSFLQETFQQESQEIWEGVELTIPANILVTKLDAVFYIGIRFPLDEIV